MQCLISGENPSLTLHDWGVARKYELFSGCIMMYDYVHPMDDQHAPVKIQYDPVYIH